MRDHAVRRLKLLFSLLLVGSSLGQALTAIACSCAYPGPPCRALLQTDGAFLGKVLEISDDRIAATTSEDLPPRSRRVRFLVEENFRGAGVTRGGHLDVLTGSGGGDCGYDFVVGERYLVYAQHYPSSQFLYTSICSRTMKRSEAAADLAYLRARHEPDRAAGIEGTIVELRRDPKTKDTHAVGPMRGVWVVAERHGDGERRRAKTDRDGHFRIWGLTFGTYRVQAELPKKFVPEATTRDHVNVESGVCGWVHMLATPWP